MATESADGPETTVSLPAPLEEWVDERAASLGVDREELLVQVLSAYRATADLDGDVEGATGSTDVSERIQTEVEAQLRERDGEISTVDGRIDSLEADLEEDLESLRNRVLQLRDAVRNRAKTDHSHEELARLSDRLDEVATGVADLSEAVDEVESDLADADAKLDTLARVVLRLRNDSSGRSPESRRHLERLRETANRRGVSEASCDACGESVSIPLLTEAACPHCDAALRDITTTGIIFSRAKLTGPEPEHAPEPAPDSGDDDDE
ncbi:hypothetical protein [Natronomonas marina]|jgi:DNA repair exonuclease SbcCD ATPase subunit|uniref:hypothetical protein n=1 Tax=Natronomonas marina TaxID=2961939 RepID=UPI0020C98626|nr:hypothetical protein [Natronomonas marina]